MEPLGCEDLESLSGQVPTYSTVNEWEILKEPATVGDAEDVMVLLEGFDISSSGVSFGPLLKGRVTPLLK